ncbi:MAG: hypothetical protein JSV88_19650 [Candidatus Aminicenantes bacterium]|nr:MAG: hypothetical protein JSV88_19650 [Candidatus Aminicenantes bacterium]
MDNKMLDYYRQEVLKKYMYLDISFYSNTTDKTVEKLQNTPIDKIFIDVDFTEYGTKNERYIGPYAMLADSNDKVILAEPGWGKTTFLKFILSRKIQEQVIPVYWEWEKFYYRIENVDFDTVVTNYFKDAFQNFPGITTEAIKGFMEKNKFVFLIDGLDEVVTEQKLSTIRKTLINYRENKNISRDDYFIIASRITNYPREYFDLFSGIGFQHYKINPLNGHLIYNYIVKFITYVYMSSPEKLKIKDKIDYLEQYIQTRPGVKKLAENPLFLNLITLIYHYEGDLPRNKLKLYEKCIEMLLYEWKKSYKDIKVFTQLHLNDKSLKNLLVETAFEYFNKFLNNEVKEFGTFSQEELEKTMAQVYKKSVSREINMGEVEDAISSLFFYFKSDVGVIVEKANGKFGFSHLKLMEYLAATYLNKTYYQTEESLKYIINILGSPRFRDIGETILLQIEMIGARFIDNLTKELLSLYKKQPNENILILLAKLVKDNDEFSIDDTGEILNLLAVYKATRPGNTEISQIIDDIFCFSKIFRREFAYLISRLIREKEKWMNFSEKAAYWVGEKVLYMKNDLKSFGKAHQKIKKPTPAQESHRIVKRVKDQLELLEKVVEGYKEMAIEYNIMCQRHNTNALMEEIIKKFRKKYPGVDIIYSPSFVMNDQEKEVHADKYLIEQIFEELIKNSIKHSAFKNGKIKIELSTEYNETSFVIHFKERGRGIPEPSKNKIFDPFFSTDNQSIGIGLAKVRMIVENLGGEIKYVGQENVGVHFKITLESGRGMW